MAYRFEKYPTPAFIWECWECWETCPFQLALWNSSKRSNIPNQYIIYPLPVLIPSSLFPGLGCFWCTGQWATFRCTTVDSLWGCSPCQRSLFYFIFFKATKTVSLAPDPKHDVRIPSLGQEILFHQELINPVKLPLVSFLSASFFHHQDRRSFYEFASRTQVLVKRDLSIQVIGISLGSSLVRTLAVCVLLGLPSGRHLAGSVHILKEIFLEKCD